MSDLSNIASDIVEEVTDEIKAVGKAAKGQIIPRKSGKVDQSGDEKLTELKKRKGIERKKMLDQQINQLRQLRASTKSLPAHVKDDLTTTNNIPQLKRVEGWRTEVARHRQEIGASKGKG